MCLYMHIYQQGIQRIKVKIGAMNFLEKELQILPKRILAVVFMCKECLKNMLHMIVHFDMRHYWLDGRLNKELIILFFTYIFCVYLCETEREFNSTIEVF